MTRPFPRPLPPPWDRIFPLVTQTFVWALLFGIVYLLRSFFLLIFLTFVFAYVQAHGVEQLARIIRNRPIRVVLVALVFLGVLVGIGFWMVPHVKEQATKIGASYPQIMESIDGEIERARQNYPTLRGLLPEEATVKGDNARDLIKRLLGFAEAAPDQEIHSKSLKALTNVGVPLLAISSAFLLSLLFSFLFVLYLPSLSALVQKLENTKLRFIYVEAADNIREFGVVLGRSLEAQLMIALVNTALTALGLWIMGLPSIAFLSSIVFFCSFVPVAGVFISSVPICILALIEHDGGPSMMLIAILLITIIHMIETYVLNPAIVGHHLHVNPVIVLVVLTIAGKLFHIWGLVLGVPIVTYFFGHAIQHREPRDPTPSLPFHT